MSSEQQFCTFYLGDLFLGLEVHHVQEVLRYQAMTEVPLTNAVIEGLINLRGKIVTAVNLRQRFGLDDRSEGALPMNVVVRTDEGVVSLLVDEIGDVLEVAHASFEQPPRTLGGVARNLIRGVYKLESRLLLILDLEQTLSFDATACHEQIGSIP